MKTSLLSTIFISAVFANPMKSPNQPLIRARNDLGACRQAINCEVVDPQTRSGANPSLARIRFKPDMDPGSAFYQDLTARKPHKHKRADNGTVETQVTLADTKVGYGCSLRGHADPHAMLGNLNQVCTSNGSCIEGETYEKKIHVVDCGTGACGLQDVTWTLRGEGTYPEELQEAFVQAVQSLAGTGYESTHQEYVATDMITGTNSSYNCNAIKQTGEYHVSRYVQMGEEKVLQGFIVAQVSIPQEERGMCDALGPFIAGGEMAEAIPGIGPAIAGIFGAVSAACESLG